MPRARIAAGSAAAGIEFVLDRKFGVDRAAVALGARQQFRQVVIALRADHEVDCRRAAHDLLAFGLRDAAGDRDRHVAAVARGFSFISRSRPSSE